MKKSILAILLLLCIVLSLSACAGTPTTSETPETPETPITPETLSEPIELNISAAASLTGALTQIADKYKDVAPDVTLTFNFGASGTLQTQIEENAPADLFISAAKKQMDALEETNLILKDTRKDLLLNKVVLIVPKGSTADIKGFEDCLTDKVKMIAIGDPESVPAGQYAKDIFTSLNGWDIISAKANLGTDVKQVLSWTASGDVDCGIVYSTDAKSSTDVEIISEAPEGSHKPVIYPAALVAYTEKQEAAQAFLDYLSTDDAKQIFVEQGFTIA